MKKIEYKEMIFLPNSRFDPQGRLFTYGNNLYRLMLKYDLDYYKKLLSIISKSEILSKHIIETKISDLTTDQNNVILQHEFLNLVSYPGNWSSEMYKDAFLAYCLINLELIKENYTLQDAHPWNITFKNCNPVFLDFGSIIPNDKYTKKGLYNEYLRCLFYPFYLMKKGKVDTARRYLVDSLHGQSLERRDVIGYLSLKDLFEFIYQLILKNKFVSSDFFLKHFISYIRSTQLPKPNSQWLEYHEDEMLRDKDKSKWHKKQKNAFEILKEKNPTSVLDVGCATGYYSFMAAKLNIPTISLDSDDYCINTFYSFAKKDNLKITPLVDDLFKLKINNKKYQCDMVFALAILHHLVFTQKYTFEEICDVLSYYSKKWLITEFIGENDPFVKERINESFKFYTIDNLVKILKRYYAKISFLESTSGNTRTLIFCEKGNTFGAPSTKGEE